MINVICNHLLIEVYNTEASHKSQSAMINYSLYNFKNKSVHFFWKTQGFIQKEEECVHNCTQPLVSSPFSI